MMKKSLFIIAVVICLVFTACLPYSGHTYTKEDVVKKCGFANERTRDFTMKGVNCVNVMPSKSSIDDHFDYMDFYVFGSRADAEKAFKGTEEWFRSIEDEGSDFHRGWLEGVCDADIEEYVYLTGNMIITVEMQCVSCWAVEVIDENDPIALEPDLAVREWTPEYRQEIIDLMRKTF